MKDDDLLKLYRVFFIFGDSACLKILFELSRNDECTFTDLKTHLHLNPATLSKKLKLLTSFSLVTSDRSHDRLRVFYSLNEHQRPVKRILAELERVSYEL